MATIGKKIIDIICIELGNENCRCYDSEIIRKIEQLTDEDCHKLIGKQNLRTYIDSLTKQELLTLRGIINGKLSRRTITKEQQDKMQAARKKAPTKS